MARDFIAQDGSYQSYDLAEVRRDDSLSEQDVRVANRIIARMGSEDVDRILSRAPAASEALARIPAEASLADDDSAVPWEPIHGLFQAFEGLPGVGLARLTKVLHKKRPALVPILDSVVEQYLVVVAGVVMGGLADRGVALSRAYKEELDACFPVLRCIRAELFKDGIDLTECRLLDIFLWAYSGQYDPLWRRARGTGVPTDAAPAMPPAALGEAVPDDVQVFRDAESDYLSWIATNTTGWVVNCGRSPRPSYLILHRADCWTIGVSGAGNFTTRDYIKVCSVDRDGLDDWARNAVGGQLTICGFCEGRVAQDVDKRGSPPR